MEHTIDGVQYTPSYYTTAMQQVLNAAPYAADAADLQWSEVYATTRPVGAWPFRCT